MKNKLTHLVWALALLAGLAPRFTSAVAQGTAFSYSGRFNDGTNPATGTYDLSFTLYDAATNGTAFGVLTNTGTSITHGFFAVTLDFGGVFTGSNYWLELAARTNGGGAFSLLSPRQPILPGPYAIYSANAGAAETAVTATAAGTATLAASANTVAGQNITGTVPLAQLPAAVLTNNQSGVALSGAFTGTFNGNGGGLTNMPAAGLTGTVADSLLSSNIARLEVPNTAVQATAGVIVVSGFIVGTTNLNGGLGYTNIPLVTVTDASGSNAVITATVSNGVVTGLTVQAAGKNYSTNATLTMAPPPDNSYQTFSSGLIFNNPSNVFAGTFSGSGSLSGTFTGNGGNLTNLNAASLTGTAAGLTVGNLTVSTNLYLAAGSSNTGIIYSGGTPLLHALGTNNFFAGLNAGNLTMTGTNNVVVGINALATNTTGYQNTAQGYAALQRNTSGYQNTANGMQALQSNTAGYWNTGVGQHALWSNTNGYGNAALGASALANNTSGNQNTASGASALAGNTTGSENSASGEAALQNNTTGSYNTANGYQALLSNTTGDYNSANGLQALYHNTSGYYNTANGWLALYSNTSGNANSANGPHTLYSNTTGGYNVANGDSSLYDNLSGSYNVANGYFCLHNNTTGYYNSANGAYALQGNQTGWQNTANGYEALENNTIGADNSAHGAYALQDNQTGDYNTADGVNALVSNLSGNGNAATGGNALYGNTTGAENTANGYQSLYFNASGNLSVADGFEALFFNTTGNNNTASGSQALFDNTTGNNNIAVGYQSGYNVTVGNSNIEIGNAGTTNDNDTINLGTQGVQTTTAIAGIFGATAASGVPVYVTSSGQLGTLTSSARFKTDIHTMNHASDVLLALQPVTFRYQRDIDPQGTPQFGLVAEDVAKVDPDLVARDARGEIYTVRYEAVNAMLLNEFLKQHQTVQEQATEIQALKTRLEKLEQILEAGK